MTLIEMLKSNTKRFPEKVAIIYHQIQMTYQELDESVNKVAKALMDLGIHKGDRVGLMLPRVPELIISFISTVMVQGIVVPINFEWLDKEIRLSLSLISPRCLIVHKQFYDLAKRSIPSTLDIPIIVVGGRGDETSLAWEEVLRSEVAEVPLRENNQEDIVYLNFTSGSTGNPKGAITTHSNLYWNTLASVNTFQMTSDDVHLCLFAPFAHPHELFARGLYLGGTLVLVDKIFPKTIAEAISQHQVTCMMGLAPMYENLLDALEYKILDLSSLRIPESGGMFTRTELINRFRKKFGVPILPVWGSTETTGIAIANRPNEPILPGSVGKPCSSYEIKIVDDNDKELPPGEIGEMVIRGPGVVQGYYQDTIHTQIYFKDRWYHSGDLGRRDQENNFYFIDRKTGMMKVAGLKVFPLEIELVLMEHPDIQEVAVISIKDKLRGEIPKALIVSKNGKDLTNKEVMDFCRERMPTYKVPRIIELREALPKTGSGKINKKELQREMLTKANC